jgi:hypothetical protein
VRHWRAEHAGGLRQAGEGARVAAHRARAARRGAALHGLREEARVNWIAAHASILLALTAIPLTLCMVPTVLAQRRQRASTVPLATSVPTAVAMLVLVVVFSALGFWLTVAVDAVAAALWAIIVLQRVQYA